MKNISEQIGLIELCFSGHHQSNEFQKVNTIMLNDLVFTIKEQNKEIAILKSAKKQLPDPDYFISKRKNLGLSQRELAEKVNISHSTISRIERGEDCDYSSIIELYKYFNQ